MFGSAVDFFARQHRVLLLGGVWRLSATPRKDRNLDLKSEYPVVPAENMLYFFTGQWNRKLSLASCINRDNDKYN